MTIQGDYLVFPAAIIATIIAVVVVYVGWKLMKAPQSDKTYGRFLVLLCSAVGIYGFCVFMAMRSAFFGYMSLIFLAMFASYWIILLTTKLYAKLRRR